MGWYRKNRGRCNINKKRLNRLLIILIFVFIVSILNTIYIDKSINSVLKPYIDIEVERLTNNIVLKSIHECLDDEFEYDIFEQIKKQGVEDNNTYYDTKKLNKIKNKITDKVQYNLLNLDNGNIDNTFLADKTSKSRFKKIKNGIICDVSIDSLKKFSLFANVSPTIPIRLVFSNQLNSDIDIDVKEYGINNAIVQVYLKITIKEQVIMPLSSKRSNIVIREPILVDIIKGDVPNYYNGYLK